MAGGSSVFWVALIGTFLLAGLFVNQPTSPGWSLCSAATTERSRERLPRVNPFARKTAGLSTYPHL